MFRQSEVGDFIMILCFSGTGNSRYIAKKIAAELEDEIVDVNAKIKAADYSPVKTGENVNCFSLEFSKSTPSARTRENAKNCTWRLAVISLFS